VLDTNTQSDCATVQRQRHTCSKQSDGKDNTLKVGLAKDAGKADKT
jgi:hypothetical protein